MTTIRNNDIALKSWPSQVRRADIRAGSQEAAHVSGPSDSYSGPSVKLTPDPYFAYQELPIADLRGALKWRPGDDGMSGTEANVQVTSDYHLLGNQIQKYFAGDPNGPALPVVADFATLAKFGSRLGGDTIRDLENLMKGDPFSLTHAVRDMSNRQTITQGAMMGLSTLSRNLAKLPTHGISKVAVDTTLESVRTFSKMRNVMVEGNTTIHDSASRAYDAFLKGETSGEGGMVALEKAGYFPGSADDRLGMYTEAFGRYKQARDLGVQAQKETDPAARLALLERRDKLMKEANIRLFIHEQTILESPSMYLDKDIKHAVSSIGGAMALKDANGVYPLLPQGGDWTDFKSRMGFLEVTPDTPGAIVVIDPLAPTQKAYLIDPDATGTVSHFSNDRTTGPNASSLPSTFPPPLVNRPVSSTGRGIERVGQNLGTGDLVGALSEATFVPARIGGDALFYGGELLSRRGDSTLELAEFTRITNLIDRPGEGSSFGRWNAHLLAGVGEMEKTVGTSLQKAGRVMDTVAAQLSLTLNAAWAVLGPPIFGLI